MRSLNQLEEKLDPQIFVRTSRHQIVNLGCVRGASSNDSGGLDLLLEDGTKVEVSRRRASQFKRFSALSTS